MKLKEINRTANVAWSPKQQHPLYIAAGTAAQQLDASFSTSAALEIYHVNFESKDLNMPVVGTLNTEHRFNMVHWTDFGMSNDECPNGMIIGGTDNGEICVFDANAIIEGDNELAIAHTLTDHNGPVTALDVNTFQSNLLSSGASDSEIFIWDLNSPDNALTPGKQTAPPDQISCLKWNQQVQHILASSTQTGRVVIWDLRKSEPVIKVGDQSAMFHYKSIAWHPDVATQLVVGNEVDRYPVIQMWDLRFATSPMKIFEGHTRGILSLDWCSQDSDLLLSCGKDNKILCWNPNSQGQNAEIVYDLPTNSQWTNDVRWCPRNAGIISASAFDGHVTVSTVMGGSQTLEQQQNQNQISDAFGIQQDAFIPATPQQTTHYVEPIKKPPKWMRRPCGARFAFGGKLISFGHNPKDPATLKEVQISQVVTETEFVQRSHKLENSLVTDQLVDFCARKISGESDPQEKLLWEFLQSNFKSEPRMEFLKLLGYDHKELSKKLSSMSGSAKGSTLVQGVNPAELASKMERLKTQGEDVALISNGLVSPFIEQKTPPNSEGSAMFDTIAQQQPEEVDEFTRVVQPFSIPTTDDTDGLVCQALLAGNFEAAVDLCFQEKRITDAMLLAVAGGPELFTRTQKRYLDQAVTSVSKLIAAVVNRDWRNIVEQTKIENWKEALCTLVTYCKAEEFSELCCLLGGRLETEADDINGAMVCYICAGNVDRLVASWTRLQSSSEANPLHLQNLIEKVMVLRKSVENEQIQQGDATNMSKQLCDYATLLSSQGDLKTAVLYLSTVSNHEVNVLKDRIYKSAGNLHAQAPQFPFQYVDVGASKPAGNTWNQQQQPHKYSNPTTPTNRTSYNAPAPTYNNAPISSMPNYQYNPSMNTNSNQMPTNPHQLNNHQMPSNPHQMTPNMNQMPPNPHQMPVNPHQMPANPHQMPANPHQMPSTMQPGVPSSQYNMPPPSQPIAPSSMSNLMNPTTNYPPNPTTTNYPPNNVAQPVMFNPMANTAGHAPLAMYNPPTSQHLKQDIAPPPVGSVPPSPMRSMNNAMPPSNAPNTPMSLYTPQTSQPMAPGVPPNTLSPGGVPKLPPGSLTPTQPEIKKEMAAPKAEVIKGPIPSEHMILQETFDAIVSRCKTASSNPQTKRKLDDVRKKLEVLYDLLRDNKVSLKVLNGLHQMSQVSQMSNYNAGIQIYTQMIATGNFSEISAFMPGLKTLMQIAAQLKV